MFSISSAMAFDCIVIGGRTGGALGRRQRASPHDCVALGVNGEDSYRPEASVNRAWRIYRHCTIAQTIVNCIVPNCGRLIRTAVLHSARRLLKKGIDPSVHGHE